MGNGLCIDTSTGTLVINGVSMHTTAWCVGDLLELWGFGGKTRSQNTVIPGFGGVAANPVWVTETGHSIQIRITGRAVGPGVSTEANPMSQLQANLDYLITNVIDPPAAPIATRSATLTLPSGDVRTADIQIIGMDLSDHAAPEVTATIFINIPAGAFA